MEWRIIFAVLCLFGILPVPGNGLSSSNSNAPPREINISFSIADTFQSVYSNMSAPETLSLISNITTQIQPVFKSRFPNFQKMLIREFRNGSIVTNGALQFDNNDISPNETNVRQLLIDAVAAGNVTLKIDNSTINVTAPPPPPATPNVEFNISFSIAETFKAVYSDLSAPETVTLIKNITTQIEPVYKKLFPKFLQMVIKKLSNGSIVVDSALQFDSNGTTPNATDVKQVFIDAVANGNVTINIKNDSINVMAPATVTPVTPTNATNTTSNTALFTLVFSILDTFNDTLSDLTSSDAITLQTKIANQFGNVLKKRHTNYLRMLIQKFSKGSIVTNSSLEFNSTAGTVAAKDVVDTIIQGIQNGNFTFKIDQTTIKVTDSSGNTTTPNANTTSNETSPNVTVPANITTPLEFNISFSIADTFKAVYNNMTDPETLSLINNITTQIEPVYKKRFSKFLRMVIKKFSNGSILTDAALQFDSNGTTPNATDLKQVLIDALANGNVTINIKNDSINVTAPATVTPVTPTSATNTTSNTALFNVSFSIVDTFNDTLSNLTSSDAITLQTKIISQFGNVFKKRFTNYLQMLIQKFSKGSIVTNSSLEFNSTVTVAAQEVVDTIIEGIQKGNFTFKIDQKSIRVTDPSGKTVSSSSRVITSMLTVLMMSLASLLLSGVIRL